MKNDHRILLIVLLILAVVIVVGLYYVPNTLDGVKQETRVLTCKNYRIEAIAAYYKDPVMHRNFDLDGDKKPCE